MLLELSEFCHYVTRVKISETGAGGPRRFPKSSAAPARRSRKTLSMGALTRAWTLIMNGYEDVKDSPRPLASLGYGARSASPTPPICRARRRRCASSPKAARFPRRDRRPLGAGADRRRRALAVARRRRPRRRPRRGLQRFEDVVALARAKRDVALTRALEHDMRIARFEPGRIEFTPTPTASPTLAPTAREKTRGLDRRALDDRHRARRDRADAARDGGGERETKSARAPPRTPSCARCWSNFPARKIVAVRAPKLMPPEAPPPTEAPDEDVGYVEPPDPDEDI